MIYKFSPPNCNALANIRNKSIYFRHYAEFNDPFEFWSTHITGMPRYNVERERFIEAIKAWGFTVDRLQVAIELHKEYFEEIEDYEPDFGLIYDHTRIACFASDPTSLLMWAHYGEGLRGFCAAYDPGLLSRITKNCYLTEVKYSLAPPVVDSFLYALALDQYEYHMMAIEEETRAATESNMIKDYQEAADAAMKQMHSIWQQAFASKPIDWKYEREKRLLVHSRETEQRSELIEFQDGTLKEIIVGERMTNEYKDKLVKIVSSSLGNIPIKEAKRIPESYKIIVE